ncbi:tellurite resistance protein TehA-like permease [Duganella sp. 1411]|uniref:SLAC1 family transporter n=1 Tax=Duganella sp. 1411 TaxID=2806572 RepID=UPI001AE95CD0|nr:tellurite resistance protein TehA-like permease [Duganella sp. 1411]
MHPDHIGGLGAGTRVFPNAVVYADQRDARYWLSKTSMAQARADQQSYSDFFVQMLLGYGLYQSALALRLLPWIRQQPFAPSYWSFSFGVAALANLTLRLHERMPGRLTAVLAPLTLAGASLVIGGLMLGTTHLAWRGRLVPAIAR